MNKAASVESQSELNWTEYSVPELETFIEEITGEIKRQQEVKRDELRDRFIEMAKQAGLTPSQVMGWPAEAGKKRSVKVKYRHPSGATWTGRGRKPGWMVQELEAGKKLEDFAV